MDLTRGINGVITPTSLTSPVLVLDQSNFQSSLRLRQVLQDLMVNRATSEPPPLSYELI